MMATLGTGRDAKVILEDGNLSESIPLKRGRPQGDSPSPRQYNIGEQVCLLKIEFDSRIESVFFQRGAPRPLEHYLDENKISMEVINGSDKTDAFADDTNVTAQQKVSVLTGLKDILTEFAVISGLKCNLEKTCIMKIGPTNQDEWDQIVELGFSVVDTMKILGFSLGPDGLIENEMLSCAHAKINQLAGCWSRFNLSLRGRIAVSKTLLISQVTYFGPVLDPANVHIDRIQQTVDNFVIRGMPVAADRKYIHPDKGGLGLIKIIDLWDSLKCSWFKRIITDGINENWRLQIMEKCFNNLICFRPDTALQPEGRIEPVIGKGFWRFLVCFWQKNENFLGAPLINNPMFIRGRGDNGRMDNGLVDDRLIGKQDFLLHKESWLKLTIGELWQNNNFISFNNLRLTVGYDLSFNLYLHIRKATAHAIVKYKNRENSNGTTITVNTFLSRKLHGSSSFRKIIQAEKIGTG